MSEPTAENDPPSPRRGHTTDDPEAWARYAAGNDETAIPWSRQDEIRQGAEDEIAALLPSAAENGLRRGWFADWDNDATDDYGWQPCLETGQGHIPSFQVWFKTKAECEEWITANVVGVDWFPGEPTETRPIPPER